MAYYIMNSSGTKMLGELDLHGNRTAKNWFISDEIHEELASEDSSSSDDISVGEATRGQTKGWNSYVQMTIPRNSRYFDILTTNGTLLLHDVDGYTQAYRITDVTVSSTAKKADIVAYNLALFNLKHVVPPKLDLKGASSKIVFNTIFEKTGWVLKTNEFSGTGAISLDGTSSGNVALQTALQTFNCEIKAYVTVKNGAIQDKFVEIADSLGEGKSTGKRVEYGFNATEISKQVTDGALITKLYVYGKNGLTVAKATNGIGKPYIKDVSANNEWNAGSEFFLEGVATNESINNPNGLYTWGKKILDFYNHPRANYTVDVSYGFQATMGEVVRVLDRTTNLTVVAKVIQKIISESNPTSNKIVLGEFLAVRNVTPRAIRTMVNRILDGDRVQELITQAMNGASTVNTTILHPDGTDWAEGEKTKRFIGHIEIGQTDITPYIENAGFVWTAENGDGIGDPDFYEQHLNDGALIKVKKGEVATGTISLGLDPAHVSTENRWTLNPNEYDFVLKDWAYHDQLDQWGDPLPAPQFMRPVTIGGVTGWLVSGDYKGRNLDKNRFTATIYSLFDSTWQYQSSMVVNGGGHGSNFGYDEQGYIWSPCKTGTAKNFQWHVTRFPYNGGTVVDTDYTPHYDSGKNYKTVNYNNQNQCVMVRDAKTGIINLIPRDFLITGQTEPAYSITTSEYSFVPSEQTFQSFSGYDDYLFWTSGDEDMHDARMLYCVDAVTKSLVFAQEITLTDLAAVSTIQEPETILFDGQNLYWELLLDVNGNTYKHAYLVKFDMTGRKPEPAVPLVDPVEN